MSKNESEFARYYSIERPSVTKQGRSLRSYFQGTSCNLNFGVVVVGDVVLVLFCYFISFFFLVFCTNSVCGNYWGLPLYLLIFCCVGT